jgi:hypothetical protein
MTTVLLVVTIRVEAHPIEYHMQPLRAETVERVLISLDILIDELERIGAVDSLRETGASERRIPIWPIQAAVASPTGGSLVQSPAIRRAVLQAGYDDGPFMVEEWQLDVDRVLDIYESISIGTHTGDPAHDHEADRSMVSRYLQQLDARARRLWGE